MLSNLKASALTEKFVCAIETIHDWPNTPGKRLSPEKLESLSKLRQQFQLYAGIGAGSVAIAYDLSSLVIVASSIAGSMAGRFGAGIYIQNNKS